MPSEVRVVGTSTAEGRIVDLFELITKGQTAELITAVEADPARALVSNADGATLLSFAGYMGNAEARDAIRRALPQLTPYEAIIVGDDGALRAAIEGGWDPNRRSPDGFSALSLAPFFGNRAAFDLLLPVTADVNQRATNAQQVAALHAATAVKDASAVDKLLRAGADPDLPQQQGFRALHAAAQHGDAAIAGLLILFGASLTLPNDAGKTAADLADEGGHQWMAARLRRLSR